MTLTKTTKRILAASASVAAAVAGGFVAARAVAKMDIHSKLGRYGRVRCFTGRDDQKRPMRFMSVGGVYQSATYLDPDMRNELPFEYFRAFDRFRDANIAHPHVCMLGGGGYAYPKYALTHFDDVSMDVVEADPAVTDMALRYFFLDDLVLEYGQGDDARLRLFSTTALNHLAAHVGEYDVIIDDVFAGVLAAGAMSSYEQLVVAKAALAPDGVYLANIVQPSAEDALAQPSAEGGALRITEPEAAMDIACDVFTHAYLVECSDEAFSSDRNFLVICSDADYPFQGVQEHRCSVSAGGEAVAVGGEADASGKPDVHLCI